MDRREFLKLLASVPLVGLSTKLFGRSEIVAESSKAVYAPRHKRNVAMEAGVSAKIPRHLDGMRITEIFTQTQNPAEQVSGKVEVSIGSQGGVPRDRIFMDCNATVNPKAITVFAGDSIMTRTNCPDRVFVGVELE